MALDAELGLAAVFGVVLLQQLGAPIPAWPVLMLLGPLAAADPRVGAAALGVATAASLAGSLPWFWAGRRYGHRVLRLTCRVSLSPDACVRQSESLFERYGAAALLAAKFIPGLSHVAPPVAGALGHGVARFTLYFGAGSALGALAPLLAGVAFRAQIDPLVAWLGDMTAWALAAVVVVVCLYAGYRWAVRIWYVRMLRGARISVGELQGLIGRGDAPVVLDVRSRTHRMLDGRIIPGAYAVDLDDLTPALARIPAGRDVVVYCACPNDATAMKVAMLLRRRGIREVRPLQGGFDAWVSAGLVTSRPGGDPV
jgi:membrane protein DedA with SNARE-associated domain/rhodanese-related sulfurtransferase